MDADWWYAAHQARRDRADAASASNAKSLTMSPRNDGSSTPSRVSVADGARLGELPGDAPDLHRGHAAAVGEHDGHLQDDLELVADGVGRERVERLGAVAGLQHERLAARRRRPSASVRLRASPANTSGGTARSSSSARVERAPRRASRAAASAGRVAPASRGSTSAMWKSSPSGWSALVPSQVPARARRRRRCPGSSAPAPHLVELLLRHRLLGEQRGLDAVEQAFEPADELGLREPQLRLGRGRRSVNGSTTSLSSCRRSGESTPSSSSSDCSWISRRRRRPASSSGARRTSSSMVRTIEAMRMSFVGLVICSPPRPRPSAVAAWAAAAAASMRRRPAPAGHARGRAGSVPHPAWSRG